MLPCRGTKSGFVSSSVRRTLVWVSKRNFELLRPQRWKPKRSGFLSVGGGAARAGDPGSWLLIARARACHATIFCAAVLPGYARRSMPFPRVRLRFPATNSQRCGGTSRVIVATQSEPCSWAMFLDQIRSKRSKVITLVHASTKSRTNSSCASSEA